MVFHDLSATNIWKVLAISGPVLTWPTTLKTAPRFKQRPVFCQAAFTLFKIVNTRLNSVYIDLSSSETSINFFYLISAVSGLIWRLAAVHSETRLRWVACQSSGLVVGGVLNDVGDKIFLRVDEF